MQELHGRVAPHVVAQQFVGAEQTEMEAKGVMEDGLCLVIVFHTSRA